MSRLTEKLARAQGVALRQSDKIEKRADALIARETSIERRTEEAFSPHEGVLSEAERGLDSLENALGQMSNSPLPRSGEPLQGTPVPELKLSDPPAVGNAATLTFQEHR